MGACMYKAAYQDPVITLKNVGVKSLSVSGGTLNVVLGVQNPNGSPIEGRRVSYRVAKVSDGTALCEGAREEPFAVPSRGSATVTVPVQFKWGAVGAVGKSVMNRGATDLKVSGEVTVHSRVIGDVTIPFSQVARVIIR